MAEKKKPVRFCEKGHPQEESWEQCPFCAAEKNDTAPAPEEKTTPEGEPATIASPSRSVIVVPRKGSDRGLAGWLVALNGEQTGQDFRLLEGKNLIGKASPSDIVIRDAYVSAKHAVLEFADGRYVLRDEGSKNGTFVNGERIAADRELAPDDLIRVGRTELKFKPL